MLSPYLKGNIIEAGCDEAGRGCLAGPVVAAAVILGKNGLEGVRDSKKLTEDRRDALRSIIEKEAVEWSVAWVPPEEIDRINILNASILAMHRALDILKTKPDHLIIDGNRFSPYRDIKHTCIVKADGKYASVAAASILAKTHRDAYMKDLARSYPEYHWEQNKGYPTSAHRLAIRKHGHTPYHRMSFKLLPGQLTLNI